MGVVFLGFDRRGKAPDTFRDTYYIAHHHPLLFCYGHLGGIAILRAFSFLPGWDTDGVGFKDSEPKAFIHTTGRQLFFFWGVDGVTVCITVVFRLPLFLRGRSARPRWDTVFGTPFLTFFWVWEEERGLYSHRDGHDLMFSFFMLRILRTSVY